MSGWREYEDVHGTQHTVSGRVVVWPRLEGTDGIPGREILAYLPPSLARVWRADTAAVGEHRRYPVLYFHDGQNVFDERTSFVGEWAADETLETLAADGLEAIAVAVPNAGDARMDEYNPWPSRERWWRDGRRVGGRGDAYLEWLVGAVKPLVDRSFPTAMDRRATGVIGSSMGGFISLYALLARPETFALAGVMSPSLRWNDFALLRQIEQRGLPQSRIHLDIGGREWRGMMADTRRLRDLLLRGGFEEGANLHYVEERYAPHRESAWARRLPEALRFLLAETRPG